jgi:aldose 1-epimerase
LIGKFVLDDAEYRLPVNNGPNHLHGGVDGFNRRNWDLKIDEERGEVHFKLTSPDGDQGYPGNLTVTVTYSFSGPRTVKIDFAAETDKKTPVSLTNHAYFSELLIMYTIGNSFEKSISASSLVD